MIYSQLLEKFDKYKHKIVKFDTMYNLCEDTYGEEGMVGKIIDIAPDPFHGDEILIMKIDWNGFEKINEEFESHKWYIDGSEFPSKTGTMKEAGVYPNSGIEEYHVMREDGLNFNFVEDFTRVQNAQKAYSESKSEAPFIEWLADKAGF